jgi:AraC-like DNA-binding protein
MIYEEHDPSPALQPYVDRLWILEGDAAAMAPEPVLPDGHAEIIVHAGDPFVRAYDDGRLVRQESVLIGGQLTRAIALRPTGFARVVGARLRPAGASAFVRIPQRDLRNDVVPLASIDRRLGRRLLHDVSGRACGRDLVRALDRALAAVAPSPFRPTPEAVAANLALSVGGLIGVRGLSRAAGLSPRQLERRFHDHVGIPPKHFLRVVRFQEVLRSLRGPARPDWARLAADHGFYDQAHFIRDFRAFTGTTPSAWQVSDDSLTALFSAIGRRPASELDQHAR